MGELRIHSDDAASITPFWRRMPQFFAYPFNLTSLLYMIVLSLVGSVLGMVSLFGIILYIGCWIVFLRHAFAVLDRTAMGHLEPSAGSIEVSGEGSGRVYKQFGLFILFGVLTGVVAVMFGPRAAMVLWFGLNLLMPGAIMILAVTGSLGKALNPVWYAMLLRSIGWAYLLMVAFMFLLTEGASAALGLLQGVLPGMLVWPLLTLAQMYFTLIMFNMMGYVLYQYHDTLGLDVQVTPEDHAARGGAQSGLQQQVGRLIADGNINEALSLVEGHKRANWEDDQVHEQYRKVLLLADKPDKAAQHAQEYIGKLLREKKKMGRALGLYKECVERDPAFKLTDPEQVQALAVIAADMRDYATAVALNKFFASQFPKHADVPNALLRAAKLCFEHLNEPARAKQYAMYVRSKFEGSPTAEEARQYMKLIERVG